MTSQEESIPIKSIPEIFRVQSAILAAQAETTIDGILVVSGEGKILLANRRFRELWAIPEAVILNGADAAALKMATEQVCDPDEFLARVKYLYQHRDQVLRDEVRLRDGRVFDRYTAPLLGEDKTYYGRIWYFRDVTESKRNAMLEHERVSLRKAVAAMKQALRVVRQELRAPLAVLRAISELLLEVRSRNTPDFEQLLVALHTQTLRLSDAVENLLEPARCDGGPARWSWGTVVLSEVCCKAIEGISTQVDANAVSLAFRVDQPAAQMRGDARAIERLVINLLANAKKHTAKGRIDLSVRVNTATDAPRWVELSVSDTGDGIEPAVLDRLGQAFALNSGVVDDSHFEGGGLGLAICKGIAAAHGGLIRIDSEQGKGTVVTAWLRADLPGPIESDPAELQVVCRGACLQLPG